VDLLIHYILPFFGMLIALIVIHELGHYVTAKIFGVKVLEAGIGYPPRAWGFTWRDTIYSVNWLPLGGFVRLLGEEDPTDPQSLAAQAAWKRLIILVSGAFMNFVLPVFLFAVYFMLPQDVATGPAVISVVMPDSPAAAAGVKTGDIVLAVNGENVRNTAELAKEIRLRQGQTIEFLIKRNDAIEGTQQLTIPVKSRWDPEDTVHVVQDGETSSSIARDLNIPRELIWVAADIDFLLEDGQVLTFPANGRTVTYTVRDTDSVETIARRFDVETSVIREAAGLPDPDVLEPGTELRIPQGPTGISIGNLYPFTEKEHYAIWEAVPKGWDATWESLLLARNQVIALFRGGQGPAVAGPTGIAQGTGEVIKSSGWDSLLQFAALLSINLAIINVLPLPMLDGGRMTFVLIEIARRGRRIAPEKEAIVHLVGLALIITMAVVVTYLDIARIIGGKSLFS
jgi:regulator of sigma E protease